MPEGTQTFLIFVIGVMFLVLCMTKCSIEVAPLRSEILKQCLSKANHPHDCKDIGIF